MSVLPALLLWGCLGIGVAHARVESLHLLLPEEPLTALTPKFGFSATGRLDIRLHQLAIYVRHESDLKPNFGNLLLIITKLHQTPAQHCDVAYIHDEGSILATFSEPGIQDLINTGVAPPPIHYDIAIPGDYAVALVNCAGDTAVELGATIELYNMVGERRSYLSLGERPLVPLYAVAGVAFLLACAAWAACVRAGHAHALPLHYLLGCLLALKALSLLLWSIALHTIDRTGNAPGWAMAAYLLQGGTLAMMLAMIFTSWAHMRPFANPRTKVLLSIAGPLLAALYLIREYGQDQPPATTWLSWQRMLLLLNVATCAALLLPLHWGAQQLRSSTPTGVKATRVLQTLGSQLQLYMVVAAYVGLTHLAIPWLIYLLGYPYGPAYGYVWVAHLGALLAALAFYAWLAIQLRPRPNCTYLYPSGGSHVPDMEQELLVGAPSEALPAQPGAGAYMPVAAAAGSCMASAGAGAEDDACPWPASLGIGRGALPPAAERHLAAPASPALIATAEASGLAGGAAAPGMTPCQAGPAPGSDAAAAAAPPVALTVMPSGLTQHGHKVHAGADLLDGQPSLPSTTSHGGTAAPPGGSGQES